ncbi:MAG TPA: response regulator [Steroidobacteraceae bacterium]
MRRGQLKSVLYVDDEPDIREVVEMSLGVVAGLEVRTCESGESALQMLETFKPDVILLDVMMPGMDGAATFQRLRATPGLEDIPVIFMTAKALPQEVARFRELGAIGVIAKPFDAMQLGNQVRAIWEGFGNA